MKKSLVALLSISVLFTGCAARTPVYRTESLSFMDRARSKGFDKTAPGEFRDLSKAFAEGELYLSQGDVDVADRYYQLAIGKTIVLERSIALEKARKEEAARREEELRKQAEQELELKRLRQKADEEARRVAAAEAETKQKIETERGEREKQSLVRYTVRRGETLPQIAAQPEVYGDPSLWPLLYKANRDQIRDPRVLWPGQQLRIPRNLDRNDLSEARRYASERPLK